MDAVKNIHLQLKQLLLIQRPQTKAIFKIFWQMIFSFSFANVTNLGINDVKQVHYKSSPRETYITNEISFKFSFK